jgi:hypothetical protein
MQQPKSDICVICGTNEASTREHIPPKGFFKGSTGQFRTVPACNVCNNASSEDDEELRNYISILVGKQTPASKTLWEKGAHKSLKRSTKLRSKLMRSMQEVEVKTEDGTKTKRLAFSIPADLYQRVFERVTRGLYFLHIKKVLPQTIPVEIFPLHSEPNFESMELQIPTRIFSVVTGAFEYKFLIEEGNQENSLWVYTIHKSHWVGASTGALVEDVS